jgi:organic hydroperoxide reductase OsmC/OhrA
MGDATTVSTEMRFDGHRTESFFDGHPAIFLENLARVAEDSEAWSPPHLFVASVESCFFLTMLAVAKKMRVEIKSYSSTAEGLLVSPDGSHQEFREIRIRPDVTLADAADRARLPQLVKLAEEHCLVARSLKTTVRIEAPTS